MRSRCASIRALVGDDQLDVPSPSFALVQPYGANGHPIFHADLHRLGDAREVDELGLFDRADAIVLPSSGRSAPPRSSPMPRCA